MPNISDNLQSLVTAKNNIGDAITSNGGTLSTGRLEGFPNDLNNRFGEVNDTLSILLKGPTLITKNITQNGTYDAEDDNADGYSSVSVSVPNTYTVADEGKVVSNNALVAQTAYPSTITENGTYDTTTNNSVVVNINKGSASYVATKRSPMFNNKYSSNWSTMNWTGLTNFSGSVIWTDGTDIYYSSSSTNQYILDKITHTWSTMTWTGFASFTGSNVWTDGTDIYYSASTSQYKLDKSTHTWSTMSWTGPWTGFASFGGSYIWTDGTDIYYSNDSTQYVLDKSTHTWSAMSWTGLTSFYGSYIWTDGTDIYYSISSTQYVLDKSTHTWSTMTWTGYTDFAGVFIWTDGTDIYYSSGTYQYVLDKDNTILLSVKPYIE